MAVSLGSISFFVIQSVRDTLEGQIGENLQAQADSLDNLVALFLVDRAGELQVLATSDDIRSAIETRNASYAGDGDAALEEILARDAAWIEALDDDPLVQTVTSGDEQVNPAAHELSSFLGGFAAHSEVFVTDRYGGTVAATGRLSDYYQADEAWWMAGWSDGNGAVYISDPEFDESAGVTALLIAVPVRDQSGQIIGVLRSTLNVVELEQLIVGVSFGDTGRARLLAESGDLLFQPDANNLPLLSEDVRRLVAGQDAGHAIADSRLYAHAGTIGDAGSVGGQGPNQDEALAAVQELGWTTLVSQSTEEAFASVGTIMRAAIIVGSIAIFVSTAASFLLARAISRRLVGLRDAAREIGEGNLDAALPHAGADEVGQLSQSFGLMRDRLRGLIDDLRDQVRRDPLTGVLNHAAVIEELRNVIRGLPGPPPHAVAMVDVDGLKAVNDLFGHQVGDAVLTAVAGALQRDDAVVGRYGGDEFVAILRRADRVAAEQYREAVLDTIEGAGLTDPETGASVPVIASVGVAIYPEEAETVTDLIGLSDNAMYASRRHRPGGLAGRRTSDVEGNDYAAQIVGQLVPLLTSTADLSEKFRLVAHQLSVGLGYDAVDFSLFSPVPGSPVAQNTFAKAPEGLVEAWRERGRQDAEEYHPVRRIFEQSPRPIIMEDPWNDERLLEDQRNILKAADLKSVLVAPMLWEDRVIGTLGVASKDAHAFTPRDASLLLNVALQVSAIVRMEALLGELKDKSIGLEEAQDATVTLLAAAAEAHDRTTGLHLRNVRLLAEALALEVGFGKAKARELATAAILHDIGKIRVPDVVLSQAGVLSEADWEVMKLHTVWGAEFLDDRPGFGLAASVARSHHEWWDGSGYPDGLSGEEIPDAVSIASVADSFDAIVGDRPYRAGRSLDEALQEIQRCSGTQFNPRVVDALVRLHERGVTAQLRKAHPSSEAA